MVNAASATTLCRICAARPSGLGRIVIRFLYLVRADVRSPLRTQKSGVVPCGVVRPGWSFDVPASHGRYCTGCAEQCPQRSTHACRCDDPLVVHGSARYGACACLAVPSMDTYRFLVCTTLGPARGDVPGYRGVVDKAERGINPLRISLFCVTLVKLCVGVTY